MRLRAVHWTGLGLLLMGALVVGTSADAAKTPSGHPFLLIGLDGGEWSVIEDQWSQGKMPNMKALVARGVRAPLQTDYGWSPVIWTTIATGHDPDVHGITGFVVATPEGDVPVSSDLRHVPAIWNTTSQAGLKTHVLGWWGTWPAETISGINITERCNGELERCATPTSAQSQPAAHQSVPDGMSPNGKRPRFDQSAATGRPPLSPAETSTAVLEIQPLLRFTAEAVQWNCDLLNAVIGRVNMLESWTKVAEPQVTKAADFVAEHPANFSELAGFGN